MRKYHDNHDCNRDSMHGENNNVSSFFRTTTNTYVWWMKIILLMLILPVLLNHHVAFASESTTSIMGDSWALNCQDDSSQQQAASEFCHHHHSLGDKISTICMCHDEGELWPLCKQQQQLSNRKPASSPSLSSYGMCGLQTYTGCLIACSALIETVLCQDTELLQCTVVASNLRSYVS